MKFQIAALIVGLAGASAFMPVASTNKASTAAAASQKPDDAWFYKHNGGIKQEDFVARAPGDSEWFYQPWSRIGQTDFVPHTHADQFFPSPEPAAVETAPPAAAEEPVPEAPVPEQAMPQMDAAHFAGTKA